MDYHILDGAPDGNAFRVAFHVSIPVANNRAGVAYQLAIVQSRGSATFTSAVPTLDPAEQVALDAGALVEVVHEIHTNPGEALAAVRDRLDGLHTALIPRVRVDVQRRLAYWGFARNVPA